jgi:hypothetical protein
MKINPRLLFELAFGIAGLVFAWHESSINGILIFVVGSAFGYVVLARPEFEAMKSTAEESLAIAQKWEDRFIEELKESEPQ